MNIATCKLSLTLLLILLPHAAFSATNTELKNADKANTDANVFLSWLDSEKTYFSKCNPEDKGETIDLCDGTTLNKNEIKSLFQKSPADLIAFIKKQGIGLEILCKESAINKFQTWCKANVNRKYFKEVSSIHGQYLPNENAIVIHSDAYLGSMVHEYLHYLQFRNSNKIHGHTYKEDRVNIQNRLLKSMDALIATVQKMEKKGEKQKLKPYLNAAIEITNTMMKFSFWQQLIDERSLFRLYIKFQKELGISKEDVALAEKNMAFICKDPKLNTILEASECSQQK